CNLMNRRSNNNANTNSRSSGEMAESSPTPDRVVVEGPAPPATSGVPTSNHNNNAEAPPPPPPKPTGKPTPMPIISGGVLNGKAIRLVQPAYPPIARAARASGAVSVQVTLDEDGNVISARAVSGHPLLKSSAEAAARQSKFSPTRLSGQPVKVTGVIIYNFRLE